MRKSIIQRNKECYICGNPRVDLHHIMFGIGNRQVADDYGITVWLCREHHTGAYGVHHNIELDKAFKRMAQKQFEKEHSREEWMQLFNRNYLEV